MTDAAVVIGIHADLNGANRIKGALDGIASSGENVEGKTNRARGAFERLERQTRSSRDRLRDLALQGRANTTAFQNLKRQADRSSNALRRADRAASGLTRTSGLLRRSMLALGGVLGARHILNSADQYTIMDTSLKNVTNSTVEYNKVFNNLSMTAQRNGDQLTGLVNTFQKLNIALPEQVAKQTNLVKVTELLSRGFAASGTAAQTAAGASLQLTQGLATNFKAAGQELNSIIEGAPLLAKEIAIQLGGRAAADLKILAESGKLTAKIFLDALISAEAAIKKFEIPATIGRSWQRLINSAIIYQGKSDLARAGALSLSRALDSLAGSFDIIVGLSASAIAGIGGYILATNALTVSTGLATGAVATFNAVLMANPLALLVGTLAAAGAAIYAFRDDILSAADQFKFLGVSAAEVFFGIKNTAVEVFGSLLGIITAPIKSAYQIFEATVAQMISLANDIPGVEIGMSSSVKSAASRSFVDIIKGNADEVYRNNGTILQRIQQGTESDLATLRGEVGSTPSVNDNQPAHVVDQAIGSGSSKKVLGNLQEKIKLLQMSSKEQSIYNNLKAAGVDIDSIAGQKISDLTQRHDELSRQMERQAEIVDNVSGSFDGFLDRAISGSQSLSDNLKSLAADLAQVLLKSTISGDIGGLFGGSGGGMSSMGGGFDLLGSLGDIGGFFGFANGGVMTSSGAVPLRAYSSGGIANSPQLALYGEGKMPEAYVPLPDGRTIPVTVTGGEKGNSAPPVVVNQTINVSTGVQDTVRIEMMEMLPVFEAQTKAAIREENRRGIQ